MSTIRLDIVTAERLVFSEDVEAVVAPGVEGQLGILPHHAPLMTMLQPGELMVRKDGEEESMFISGGFLEVRGDKVIVLADTAEKAEEIDIERAEAGGPAVAGHHSPQFKISPEPSVKAGVEATVVVLMELMTKE